MIAETWDQCIVVLEAALPVLPRNAKNTVVDIIRWINAVKSEGRSVKQKWVDDINLALVTVLRDTTGNLYTDLNNVYTFLGRINKEWDVESLRSYAGCRFWGGDWWGNACHKEEWADDPGKYISPNPCIDAGYYWWLAECHKSKPDCSFHAAHFDCNINGCYWYNNKCNSTPEGEPEPEPPPEPPQPCSRITSQSECLARSCYWYGGKCHSAPRPAPTPTKRPFEQLADDAERFCKSIPIWDIPKLIVCNMFKDILRMLDDFLDFSK